VAKRLVGKRCLQTLGTAFGLVLLLAGTPAHSGDDKWGYSIEPYLWGPGIDGTLGIGGRDTDVDASLSDLVKFVDLTGSLRFEASTERWGAYGDVWFVDLSSDSEKYLLGGLVEVKDDIDMNLVISEAGGIYRISEPLNIYFGVRVQDIETKISFQTPLGTREAKNDTTITDPIVGVNFQPTFGKRKRWGLGLRGDIGAGDSDVTWLAQILGTHRFSRHWYGAVGYRHLQTDYSDDDFKYDIALNGFGIGAAYRWGGAE
jgi:hypothetical protein